MADYPSPTNPLQVIVVGAGAAGLAAARHLHETGCQVTVLKARDRLGGQVWTAFGLAPYPIELGAEYIHGEQVMTWDLLKRHHLSAVPDAARCDFYVYVDSRFTRVLERTHLPVSQLLNQYEEIAVKWAEDGHSDTNLRAVLEAWIRQHQVRLAPDEWQLVNHLVSSGWGHEVDRISAHSIQEQSFTGDGEGNFRVTQGYGPLAGVHGSKLEHRVQPSGRPHPVVYPRLPRRDRKRRDLSGRSCDCDTASWGSPS